MTAVIQKWGNSLGFMISSLWAKDNNVKNGSKIEVIAGKGDIFGLILIHEQVMNKKADVPQFVFLKNYIIRKLGLHSFVQLQVI